MKYKLELEQLYPNGIVSDLSNRDRKLYGKISYFARTSFNMKIEEYIINVLGLEYHKYSESKFDSAPLKYLSEKFHRDFTTREIYEYWGISKQRLAQMLNHEPVIGNIWYSPRIEEDLFEIINLLIDQDMVKDEDDSRLIRIYSNIDQEVNVALIGKDRVVKVYNINDSQTIEKLKYKFWFRLTRDEYNLLSNLLYDAKSFQDEYVSNRTFRENVRKIAYKNNLSVKIFMNTLGISYKHPNYKTEEEITELLSEHLIEEPNIIHIHTDDWLTYCSIVRMARRKYPEIGVKALELFARDYGYEYRFFRDTINWTCQEFCVKFDLKF
ncbi:hypothetical protein [Fusibacter ferrireducens]|uniref:Uncharacterized protein n=1 Tax=Fusibacter ferrireducens TaxID=2785058 RepID=A0ABR9ZWU9_9FIRM|nr:hypothetical protein [Fusibacter ferrireducens]MBF4694944.1 hypothetical protein [Fusibacter ferrireducens]